MADDPELDAAGAAAQRHWAQKRRWRTVVACALFLGLGLIYVWATREEIAGNLIQEQLDYYELEASYDIESIGPKQQVLRNVVIGDPDRPDLTIERVVVDLRYRFGTPAIGRVALEAPRLFGSFRDGETSFGALDAVFFAPNDEPAALPDLHLVLNDGRALIETDYGPVGIKAEGAGPLDDGFEGVVAAVAPKLAFDQCQTGQASLYGSVTTADGQPNFAGPLRLRDLTCAANGALGAASMRQADIDVTLSADSALSGVEAALDLAIRQLAFDAGDVEEINGDLRFQWRDDLFNGQYDLSVSEVASSQISLSSLAAQGSVRALDDFERVEVEADLSGSDLSLGSQLDQTLAGHQENSANTLFGPLIGKLRDGLKRQQRGSTVSGQLTARQTGNVTSLVVPSAIVRGSGGQELLSLSRAQFSTAGANGPRMAGNLRMGGDGLPDVRGRMEQRANGNLALQLAMAEYRAGDSAIALPQLSIEQTRDGAAKFTGLLSITGDLAAATVSDLELPLSGGWSARNGLSLWRNCTAARFATLQMASLTLEQRELTLCPPEGSPIVAMNDAGLQIAAGTPGLDLSGKLGESPITMRTGAIGFAYPDVMSAQDIAIELGPQDTASRFTLSQLNASFGEAIGGNFEQATVLMEQVPLDIVDAAGNWSFSDGVLSLTDGNLRVLDRAEEDRFEPLYARDATLTLAGNLITARADLRNPASDRIVTQVRMTHNLDRAIGSADLLVDDLRFDDRLQPEQLSNLAKGVIALADGVIEGSGRIDWNGDDISSGGVFSSDGIDFAAAFGPVTGAKGSVEFVDLVSLTTEPDQQITIDVINPGVEVMDGTIRFALTDGELLSVKGGEWPFMGGQLIMRPVDMRIGAEEERSYIFEVIGLDAAVFVSQMDLGNLSATGQFDGTLPIIFDASGNGRIEQGLLLSRAPGGNVSYVGELSYEDLSPIANFAFGSLRSLDYSQMSVTMEGSLTGELVTRVRFDGVKQGVDANSNIITRQLAKLPIRFNVNIRSQFYQLITQMKSLYDPAFIRDPRDIGLVDGEVPDDQIQPVDPPDPPAIKPDDINTAEPTIQTQESETMP